ncbi:dihydroxyacetone kinase family protein [Microbacterium sp. YY-01]|uniref:dihydroxyacetone kinase family protein n=1 Tax=Microbacterium sp. YY-01 TaxID=3421634 RepID=UPI003D178C3E
MSYLHNDPTRFRDEMIDGFVSVHGSLVRRVDGGVARRHRTPEGQVAVVIGGGSGHYPAFAGIVGPGLAHAAAMGNVFASPSAQQVLHAAESVATSAGVLLTYGNYAGDVLNFDQAEALLQEKGIPCRSVPITDDISSAPAHEAHKRRGVAGDLVVFKVAAWAAEQGRDLDAVAELTQLANQRTRTLGVAFSGCTLPGAEEPLFTIPEGHMGIGMGIHGEPGLEDRAIVPADDIAALLTERVLAEAPDAAGNRIAVIVNGLGSIKGEELFVLYSSVKRRLDDAGLEVVDPEVGEFVTSFEMAGVSLTICWLNDELEEAWKAPVYTPAYRKGSTNVQGEALADESARSAADAADDAASGASQQLAAPIARAVAAAASVIDANVDALGELDAIAGDGDHGIGMQRGITAASEAAEQASAAGAGAGSTLIAAGDAWADRAGGTSGALWGLALRTAGESIGNTDVPDGAGVARAVRAAIDAIAKAGGATIGDKTMMDAALPFADALDNAAASETISSAWTKAAAIARQSAEATADLLPKLGRARPHQEKSVGHPDPGAISFAMIVETIADAIHP